MFSKVTDTIYYVGVNDHDVDLFEGQYVVPNGMSYNSYVIKDTKTVVMDTVDVKKTDEWLANIAEVLGGGQPAQTRTFTPENILDAKPESFSGVGAGEPDYLVVQHMEPDHSGSIQAFCERYPNTTVVANAQIFQMIGQFFPTLEIRNKCVVDNGGQLELGMHTLNFVFAPMVHWPEVMMTYESSEKVLFAADGFGKFGALDRQEPWADEARRYFIGIVGKYGKPVQDVLAAAATLDIQKILPLHGPILVDNLGYFLDLYDKWSSYEPEEHGIVLAYTSVYGHTKEAVELLQRELITCGAQNVEVYDLARCDMAKAVDAAFKYDTVVLATTTYNGEIYPFMNDYINRLTERNFQKRNIALIENGTWAPAAAGIMREKLAGCDKLRFAKNNITILSALNDDTRGQVGALAEELAKMQGVLPQGREPIEVPAMFKIGYGLYVVTCNDGQKDTGLIVNTVAQVSDKPNRIMVNVNKANYSCEVIRRTGVLNVCTLSEDAPFSLFQRFGFQSGRDANKFEGFQYCKRATNGLPYLTKGANAFLSLKVYATVDMGTHWMFLCDITESAILNNVPSVTYNYYQANIKPAPKKQAKGWVCEVCGYIYEGDELPADFICPLCKHPASDFRKL